MAGRPRTRAKREAAARAAADAVGQSNVPDAEDAAHESANAIAGRPTLYCAELADEICTELMSGRTLSAICRSGRMPPRQTVHNWLQADAAFEARYLLARKLGAHALFDDAVDIMRDTAGDTASAVQHARNRADVYLRAAAKLDPENYSDRTRVDVNLRDLPNDLEQRYQTAREVEAAARESANARRH